MTSALRKKITFPRLRELRGKYGLTNLEISNILGLKTHTAYMSKISGCRFLFSDMVKLTKYFNSLGESETVQSLFFDWYFSNENI